MEEKKEFIFRDKVVILKTSDFEGEVNIDDILKVDYGNIIGELLTFPLILNRLGLLLSEVERAKKMSEFEVSLEKNTLEESKARIEQLAFIELKKTITSPTISQINGAILQREDYKEALKKYNDKRKDLIDVEKDYEDVKTLYWSAKGKLDIITKMTDKMSPHEFEGELVSSSINNIIIKVSKPTIA